MHFPQPNLHREKVMFPVWRYASSLIHHSFLNPVKPPYLRSRFSKLIRFAGNWTPAASFGQQKGPNSSLWQHLSTHFTTSASKVEWIGVQSCVSSPWAADLSPADWHFFKHLNQFFAGKCFHNQQDAENAFQEFVEPRSTDVYATGINKLISHLQSVLIVIIPILINKDVFKPCYNDLKFRVRNYNYFCTNLDPKELDTTEQLNWTETSRIKCRAQK